MFQPTITGLTHRQVELLDIIWSIDTLPEAELWLDSLEFRDFCDAKSLLEILELESIEHELQDQKKFPLAAKVINRIKAL
jgi:hypothetical protein